MFLLDSNDWEIKNTNEKGRGVFTKKKIPKGTIVGDYLGKVIKTEDYDLDKDMDGLYLMYFTDKACIYPDLKNPGVHLLNHSCDPNCWIYTHRGHTLFFAIKDISPGKELTISYLLCPNDGLCNPCTHECKCESTKCTKSMHLSEEKHKLWQNFQDNKKKNTRVTKFEFNKNLSKLPKYPEIFDKDPIYSIIYAVSNSRSL